MLRGCPLPRENKDAQAPWQLESLWPCRTGIEQQRLAEPFDFRLVGMAKDADVRLDFLEKHSSALCELPAFIQNMTDGDAAACQLDHGFGRTSALAIIVDVARDGGDRSDLLQLFDHGPIANVSGMENVIDASEMLLDDRIESAMGIGNHSNANGSRLVHGVATGWVPSEACTCFQSKVKGSGDFFGKAASSAFNRSALAALIGCVESHSIRP